MENQQAPVPVEMTWAYEDMRGGDFIGEVTHRLTTEMVRAFCRATGRSEHGVVSGAVAPSGLLTLLSTAPFRERTGRRSGDLHARHRYEQVSALRVGETVRTTSHVLDRYERRGRRYLVYTSQTEEIGTRRLVARCHVTLAVVA
jgi:hypothetical protein